MRRAGILFRKSGRVFLSQASEMLRITHSDGAKVLASLVETGTIRAATIFKIGKLNWVVFPPAHLAN